MKIINYNSIKDTIKKYSSSVDFNLDRAGWIEVQIDENVVGRKSRDIIVEYHKAYGHSNDTKYCYRRFTGDCGLPILIIYIKKET